MRVAVCSSKGGVGKSAVAANLAAALAVKGRTLAVDADPQESLGRAFGVVAGRADSLTAVLDPESDLEDALAGAVRYEVVSGLDLIPSHPSLEQVGIALSQQGGLVSSMRRALRPIATDYDYVVTDTHGDTGNLTLAAIAAADSVLAVFTSNPGSALGAVRIASFLATHQKFENTEARLLGVVCANWDSSGAAAREVAAALAGTHLPLLQTKVPFSRWVPSSTLAKRPVVLSHPKSAVAGAYRELADEVLASYHEGKRR